MARLQPKLSNNKKRQVQTLVEQANLACMNGRFDVCEQLCRRIESMQPDHANVANLRGIMYSQSGQPDAAIHWLKKATTAAPNRGEFFVNLGKIYLDLERWREAADSYRQAIALSKKSLPIQLNYCKALVESRQYQQALPLLEKLHKQNPRDINVLMGLFLASEPLDMLEEAESYLQAIFAIDPDHPEAHAKMGKLELQRGRLAEAEAEARKVLSILPDSARAYDILTFVKKYQDPDDPDVAGMIRLYEQSVPDTKDRQAMCFMLGKVMEQLGQYDRAFELLSEGNAIRHKKSMYDPDAELSHMEEIMAAYTPEVFVHASALDDETPIFIVGMPRCGSTLTEQILAAHPDVASRGECDIFERQVLSTLHSDDNPLTLERLTAFTPAQWEEVGRMYVEKLRDGDTAALRITDKTLTSIREIGAIHCAMPKAKIVHVRRHPLDNCLSIFKQDLQGFLFDYGYNLGELGYYYRMYLKLMQHWRNVLPKGAMYELNYERLVANQEEETRKLLDYCGLPWNDRCLQFNKTNNVVRTASVAQVRRGMYTDSMAAWKRYEKHLAPLIRILGPEYSTDYKVGG
ncbi:MAG TPA: sulfotransferase [Mariprofundaceae bacterium]|nr:sulfotransferase [Mariprofundaceae bacterium]